MNDITTIAGILAATPLRTIPLAHRKSTAVALLLRDAGCGPEVLFIERARRDGDPWSGDVGFPGGKVEATDASLRAAAERETREEIGLDLEHATYLGRLPDVVGAHMPVQVACFVYSTVGAPLTDISREEVRDHFWVNLSELGDPQRHCSSAVLFRGESFQRPGIRLPVAGKPLLWGITYRLVMEFLGVLGKVPLGGFNSMN